jgi:short-subunit dehydrogenase
MHIAIITGASSGIGNEYAHHADAEGIYDEIWVIARRTERLEQLALECTTPVRCLSLDLSQRSSTTQLADTIVKACSTEDFSIGLLVNTAGFGKFGTYADLGCEEVDDMIDVNCRSLVDLTQLTLPYMQRGARIIEFASSAAFLPLPGLNVYAASKAFVLSYTRALRRELHGKGIRVTAVCPTWVRTEFVKVARKTQNGMTVRHPWPQISPHRVVVWSTFINRTGYPVATCGIIALILRLVCKVIPSPILMWFWGIIRRI